jgi:hypothetical protein
MKLVGPGPGIDTRCERQHLPDDHSPGIAESHLTMVTRDQTRRTAGRVQRGEAEAIIDLISYPVAANRRRR